MRNPSNIPYLRKDLLEYISNREHINIDQYISNIKKSDAYESDSSINILYYVGTTARVQYNTGIEGCENPREAPA
jgi:hypothetical protein